MGGASARRVMKMMQGGEGMMPPTPVKLQVNQRHAIIKGLSGLIKTDEDTA